MMVLQVSLKAQEGKIWGYGRQRMIHLFSTLLAFMRLVGKGSGFEVLEGDVAVYNPSKEVCRVKSVKVDSYDVLQRAEIADVYRIGPEPVEITTVSTKGNNGH